MTTDNWRELSSNPNVAARVAYADCSETAGPLVVPQDEHSPVRFRRVGSPGTRVMLTLLVLLNVATGTALIGWLLRPEHVPGVLPNSLASWQLTLARIGFSLVVGVELIRLTQNFTVWLFAFKASDPIPMMPPIGLRVAILTTIVPDKEPIEVVERTLRRMRNIVYCGDVDVWILDEGDDPAVRAMAARLGVRLFSRKNRPEYNQPTGAFRARTKAGNHNAWRAEHEHDYDVVAQMDPDHVPLPNFLERTIGYFRDPDVAFVVAPQVYGNMFDNWLVHGASVQQYLFSGVVERGGNGLGAPLLIGTNHLYRPDAWRQINGYQDSIIEDHLTSMRVQAATNPVSGNHWKGVYTPDVVAIGEGPTSWADYFNQQKRWAYGIWEILLTRSKRMPRELSARQRLLYGLVQFYYPSVASSTLFGNLATALYLLTGITAVAINGHTWLALWSASMASWFTLWFWLRRFNIAAHEREEVGVPGMALALFAGPVYVSAAIAALFRRPLAYAVTAKGKLRTTESIGTFRLHLMWATVAASLLVVSRLLHHDYIALQVWCCLTLFTGIAPPLIAGLSAIAAKARRVMAARAEPTGSAAAVPAGAARGVSADATPTMVFKGGLVLPDATPTMVLNGRMVQSDASPTLVMSADAISAASICPSPVPVAATRSGAAPAGNAPSTVTPGAVPPHRAGPRRVKPGAVPPSRVTPTPAPAAVASGEGLTTNGRASESIAPVPTRRATGGTGRPAPSASAAGVRGAVNDTWRPTLVTPANGHGATYQGHSADANPQQRDGLADAADAAGG